LETVLLPDAIPPVNPTILISSQRATGSVGLSPTVCGNGDSERGLLACWEVGSEISTSNQTNLESEVINILPDLY